MNDRTDTPRANTEGDQVLELKDQLESKTRALREFELYENAQERLIAWAQRRFWWVVAIGGLIMGSSGYGLLQATLSTASRETVRAEVAANNASEVTATVEAELRELQKTSEAIQVRQKTLERTIGSIETRVASVEPSITKAESAVDILLDADNRINQLANRLEEEFGIDKHDLVVRYLISRAVDPLLSEDERSGASVALSLWPGLTAAHFTDLCDIYEREMKDTLLRMERGIDIRRMSDIRTSLAIAIFRSDKNQARGYFSNRLRPHSMEYSYVVKALDIVNETWDVDTLKWAINTFKNERLFLYDGPIASISFASAEAQHDAREYLLNQIRDKRNAGSALRIVGNRLDAELVKSMIPELNLIRNP